MTSTNCRMSVVLSILVTLLIIVALRYIS